MAKAGLKLLERIMAGETVTVRSQIDWEVYDGGGSENFVRVNLPTGKYPGRNDVANNDDDVLRKAVEVTIRLVRPHKTKGKVKA